MSGPFLVFFRRTSAASARRRSASPDGAPETSVTRARPSSLPPKGRRGMTDIHDPVQEMRDWWHTSIIDMQPGVIRYRGYAIEELIGRITFPQMIWLMTRGELPEPRQAKLLDAALMSAIDHGPQAPSIAIARMAMTCGVGMS